jgi:Ca2+-binding EF-hand superfamily protein
MKRKTVIIAAGVLLTAGAVAAVAQGHRGWRGEHGDRYGMGMQDGDGHGDREMRGRWWRGGSLTGSEHDARTRERFARLDRNSDGVIDAAELEAAFTERAGRMGRGGQMGGGERAQRMLRRFDENKDGKVTREEFTNAARKMFAEVDLTNDGRIDDNDLPPMMRGRNALSEGGMGFGRGGGGPMGGGRMMGLLRQADANKDGVVTLDEATAEAGRMFARLDRNKDNVVDQGDFDALRKETVDYRVKRFIHHFGGDRDGKVTREQFEKVTKERFALHDLNNDGTISRDEIGGGRGGWRGRDRGGDDMGERRGRGGPGAERGQGGERGPGAGPGPQREPGRN